jgi:hypothetical protein
LIRTKVVPVSQLRTATDAAILPMTVLCAVGVESPVSSRDVIGIVEIDSWASGGGEANETRT